jgi:hypothetical protein
MLVLTNESEFASLTRRAFKKLPGNVTLSSGQPTLDVVSIPEIAQHDFTTLQTTQPYNCKFLPFWNINFVLRNSWITQNLLV